MIASNATIIMNHGTISAVRMDQAHFLRNNDYVGAKKTPARIKIKYLSFRG
jgi:hypothetical protein